MPRQMRSTLEYDDAVTANCTAAQILAQTRRVETQTNPRLTHRHIVPIENDAVVGEVECSYRWLTKQIHAYDPVLLQVDILSGVEWRSWKVGGSIGREFERRLREGGVGTICK